MYIYYTVGIQLITSIQPLRYTEYTVAHRYSRRNVTLSWRGGRIVHPSQAMRRRAGRGVSETADTGTLRLASIVGLFLGRGLCPIVDY